MAERGHIEFLPSVGETSALIHVLQRGKMFKRQGGYTWEWIKKVVVDFPRTFWWITALFAFWAGHDFKCGSSTKGNQKQVQQSQEVLYILKDTCLKK